MRKKTNSASNIVINVNGNNNTIYINDDTSSAGQTSKKRKSIKTVFKALGKLIRSIFVNIMGLLFEIFTNFR